MSGAGYDGRSDEEPTRVRDTLAVVGADLGLPAPGAIAALARHWPEVAGAELAPHSRIATLRDGILTVVVEASAWVTPLRYREPEVLERVVGVVGAGVVRGLRIRVEPPA